MKKIEKILSLMLAVLMLLSVVSVGSVTATSDSNEIKVGDEIEFGSYPQSAKKDENGKVVDYNIDPIKWRVLNVKDGKALLLSSEILDAQAYHHTVSTVNGYYANNYAHSDIRKWLINDFYNIAFSNEEQSVILTTTLDNSAAPTDTGASGNYTQYSSESTNDKVFLLSKNEANSYATKYFSTTATEFAYANGFQAQTSTESCNQWRLRTAGGNKIQVYVVQIRWGTWTTYYNWYGNEFILSKNGIRPAIYIDLEAYNKHVNGKFLEGYDKDFSRYSFSNQTTNISVDDYKELFKPAKAERLQKDDDGTKGQCYGMAATTAMFLEGLPSIDTVITYRNICDSENNVLEVQEGTATNIWDMDNGAFESVSNTKDSFVGYFNINLSKFISKAFITQFKPSVVKENQSHFDDYSGLISAVENYINGGEPIVIGIRGDLGDKKNCGHSLLPVGIKKTESLYTVYVNDSNNPQWLQELRFYVNNGTITRWSYTVPGMAGMDWGSDKPNGKIYYCSPIWDVFLFCSTEADTKTRNSDEAEPEYKLLSVNNNSAVIDKNDHLLEILSENGEGQGNFLYWVDETFEEIKLSSAIEETTFSLSDDYTSISAKIPAGSKAECAVDDEAYSSIVITDVIGKDVEISVLTADEDNFINVTVTGTALENEVTATQTETGIVVEGLSSGTVTLSKNDEVIATQSIVCSDGKTEIDYDKTGANTEIDLDYTENHLDKNTDYVCDGCGKNLDPTKDCACACHKNPIVKFILMIIDFIFTIFGGNFDCNCGNSHF